MLPPSPVPFRHHPAVLRRAVIPVLLGVVGSQLAAATAPDPAAAALEQLRAANQARGEHAKAEAAWTLERQRLQALIEATLAENARLERDAATATARRDADRTALAALGRDDADTAGRLAEAGRRLDDGLNSLAKRLPPGTVPTAVEGGFDAAVRRLDASERAAAAVAVEVVTGQRDGRPTAVKVLRIAGAAAWWVALDGSAAGTVRMTDGVAQLDAAHNEAVRPAIMQALAQVEGRAQPAVIILPAAEARP